MDNEKKYVTINFVSLGLQTVRTAKTRKEVEMSRRVYYWGEVLSTGRGESWMSSSSGKDHWATERAHQQEIETMKKYWAA